MIHTQLENLYYEDKEERSQEIINIKKINISTQKRLVLVKQILNEIDTSDIWNCHYLAYLFHHGNTIEDYKQAHFYANKAVKLGSTVTKWLYAATLDRLLITQGKKQRFGTQYTEKNGKKTYLPIESPISEKEKLEYGL